MREAPAIDGYGPGGFRIAGVWWDGPVLILGDEARSWPVVSLDVLTVADFAPVFAIAEDVEFILIGAGARMAPPPRPVREAAVAAGLGLEVMDTPAAVRLYNVLASEGRRLACALIPA